MATTHGTVLWHGQLGIVRAIHHLELSTPWLHAPMLAYAKDGVVLFALLLLLSWWQVRRQGVAVAAQALWAPVGVLVALGVNQLFVHLVSEPRPYDVIGGFVPLISRSADFSFPSDHAVVVGAAAVGIYAVNRRLGVVAWALAALMAFARVYVGAHWLGDVLVGLVVGAALATIAWFVVRKPVIALVGAVARGPLAFVAPTTSSTAS